MKQFPLVPVLSAPIQGARLAVRDLQAAADTGAKGGVSGLVKLMLALLAGWWLYVPVHELLHAAGCTWSGGEIGTLQISPLYGGGILQHVFPFIEAGGEYAGRLSDFEPNGLLGYLATDLLPFVLTLFPGVYWLHRSIAKENPVTTGLSLPLAMAPWISLPGDAYEIGSLLVTLVPWFESRQDLLIGDDIALVAKQVLADGSGAALLGWSFAALVGLLWAASTYAVGVWISQRLQSE